MRRWPGIEWDDAYQVGYEALCNAAIDWNTEVGPFEGFAWHRVMFRVIDWVRRAGPAGKKFKTVEWKWEGHEYADSEITTEKLLRDDQLHADHADLVAGRMFVNYCLGLLNPRERYIMNELMVKQRSAADIARELGIHESNVHKLKSVAIRRMRYDEGVGSALWP